MKGRPFASGPDPRRGVGKAGRSGRLKDAVRAACRQAFDARRGILERIADGKLKDVSPGDRIRALDCLARYGGMVYSEQDSKVDARVTSPGEVVVYELASSGHEPGAREAAIAALVKQGLLTDQALALLQPPPPPRDPGPPPPPWSRNGTGTGAEGMNLSPQE